MSGPGVRPFADAATVLPLASVPFTTAYAVLVHKVLDVRLIARRALQYLLARYTLLGLAFGPLLIVFALLAPLLPQRFAAWQLGLLGGLTLLGLVGLLNRERLERALERAFSRERYDSRQTLTLLIDPLRSAGSLPDFARIVTRGVDRALHPRSLALFVEDSQTGRLTDPLEAFPPLDASSQLAGWVAGAPRPFDTELGAARSAVEDLSQEETSWVESGRFQLLVPLFSSQGALLGLLALGERQSGTAYSTEDRELLSALAVAAGPALELLRRKQDGPPTSEALTTDTAAGQRLVPALECHSCELLFPTPGSLCPRCSATLTEAPLPYMIPNRYRFEQRLGAGGMGIVYRGTDLALGRTVAAKTLRQAGPDEAARLRREARTAAQVLHPNLALIWDIQTWRDAPVIILEHMGGGTLNQRLRTKGPLDPWEAVDLGLALAGALEQLHRLKILHRDIKPSNIGFTQDGTPKLLDFGIARVTLDLRPEALSVLDRPTPTEALPTVIPTAHRLTRPSQRVEGTLAYVSPETLAGGRPDAAADLWSLCLVLYECLTGEPVFSGETEVDLLLSIRIGVPSLRELMPGTPRELVAFFDRNLHKNRDHRAPTAASLRAELDKVAKKLAS